MWVIIPLPPTHHRASWAPLVALSLLLAACGQPTESALTPATEASLPAPTALPAAAEPTPAPSQSPVRPSAIPAQPATPTRLPPPRPTSTATSPPTAEPSETPDVPGFIDETDRTCPDPPPARPAYDRYWLDDRPWPTPIPELESHLWLSHPLPRGDRLLTSEILPYGTDGSGRYLLHNGVDMAEPEGTPVLAVADGTVVYAGSDRESLYGWRCNWYGQLVILLLDDRWEGQPVFVLYGHVLNIQVETGQRVTRFNQVAEIGYGGAALVPHLHLEVRVGANGFDATRNPLLWLTPGSRRGVVAGRLVDPDGKPWQGYPIELVGPDASTDRTLGWTYVGDPDNLIKPDERFAENFVVSDLKPGRYEAIASVQGTIYRQDVIVEAGAIVAVELVTEAYRTPTPTPALTATSQP